jgi:hypothetical protein
MAGETELKLMVTRIIDLAKLLAQVDDPRVIDLERTEKPAADQSGLKRLTRTIGSGPNPPNRKPKN